MQGGAVGGVGVARPVLAGLFLAAFAFTAALYQVQLTERWVTLYAILPIALIAGLAAWLCRPAAPRLVSVLGAGLLGLRGGARALGLLACLGTLVLVAWGVLQAFPNSGDEYAMVLQAETYAEGRLYADGPPLPEAFRLFHFIESEGIWISQYQPGWSVLMAPFAYFGWPLWLAGPFVGLALLLAMHNLVRLQTDAQTAALATLVFGVSAFFILNAASYFAHGIAALASVLAAHAALRFLRGDGAIFMGLAGIAAGYLGFTRVYSAVIFLLPLILHVLMTPGRRVGLVWLGLGGLPFLAALLAFNTAVTGEPLLFLQFAIKDNGEPLGQFGWMTLYLSVERFLQLALWTSPLLVAGLPLAYFLLIRARRISFTDWVLPVTVLAYVVYGGAGGNQYGPRYLFDAWPLAMLTLAKAFHLAISGAAGRRALESAAAALVVSLTFQVATLAPRLEKEHRVIEERRLPYQRVAEAGLDNAVVLISRAGAGRARWMWPEDLVRNGLRIEDDPVIYAHDLGPRNAELRALFPDRAFYRYDRGRLTPLGPDP